MNQKIILLRLQKETLIGLRDALREPLAHVLQTNQAMMSTRLRGRQARFLKIQKKSIGRLQTALENILQINTLDLNHEIRTPLNGISPPNELLLSWADNGEEPLDQAQRNLMEAQEESTQRIIRLINEKFLSVGLMAPEFATGGLSN